MSGTLPTRQVTRALCLLQKPYDLINATEYLERAHPGAKVEAAVIGNHANAHAVADLCERRGIPVMRVSDPDLYAYWVAYLNAKQRVPFRILLLIKALILPIAFGYWFYAFIRAVKWGRGRQYDLIVLDAWRSKCLYASAMPRGASFVITDGGYSTLNYGLCPAFQRGGAKELTRVSLRQQRPLMPAVLRRIAVDRFSDQTPFFTCYANEFSPNRPFPVLQNDYRACRALLGVKTVRPGVMILGIPRLKHIDTYMRYALDAQAAAGLPRDAATIEYRFHPTDRNRAGLDGRYASMIEQGVRDRGMTASYPRYSVEVDFLEQEEIPAIIVSYHSSSLKWVEEVLGSKVRLVPVAER